MMEHTVGMIVPVYNGELYLERCMESLLAQTYQNTEILLIDDGSTDGSRRICDEYAGQYEKVKVFHIPNTGVSGARNKGMEECRCEYLTFVDADDILAEDMLERLVGIMEETAGDVAGCGYFEFCGDEWKGHGNTKKDTDSGTEGKGGQQKKIQKESEIEVLSGSGFVEKGILQSDTRCWSKLYRRESVGGLRFEAGLTIGEDMLFLLELAVRGKRFVRTGYKGYGYYVNEEGAMRRAFKDSYMDQIVCWQKALTVIEREQPELSGRAEAILLISVMLVVGKLAVLSGKERRGKEPYVKQCRQLVKKFAGNREAVLELDRGYRIKTKMFCYLPGLYMSLYHALRCVKALKPKDVVLFIIDNFL